MIEPLGKSGDWIELTDKINEIIDALNKLFPNVPREERVSIDR